MRREIVRALLGRDVIGVVEGGVEARRLGAGGAHGVLRIGQKLNAQRTDALLERLQIEAPHAEAACGTAQRERAPAHMKTLLRSRIEIVEQQIGTLLVETVARQDDGVPRMVVRHVRFLFA